MLRDAVPAALRAAGADPAHVVGIGTDFTACTILPTTADGTPLCELPEFAGEPHAYVKLWKHHAAQPQADRINELARKRDEPWLPRYGGLISSEWEFAKGLQLLEEAPGVYDAMDHWVEAADWIVWQLTGTYVRNACTAGYKGIHQDGGYPSSAFLRELNPAFERFVADKLDHPLGQLGDRAGGLSAQAAAWTGLCPRDRGVASATSTRTSPSRPRRPIEPGTLVAIMGTSTCHVMNGAELRRGAGHVRRRRRRHHRRALGLRGRAERRRRHLRLVRRPRCAARLPRHGRASAASRCTRCSPSWPPRRRSASTGWWRSTGTAATARCWSTTSCPGWSSARRSRPAPRTPTARCSRRPPSAPGASSRPSPTPASRSPSWWSRAAC